MANSTIEHITVGGETYDINVAGPKIVINSDGSASLVVPD